MGKVFLIIFCFAGLFLFSFLFLLELRRVSLQRVTNWNLDRKVNCAVVLTGGVGGVQEGFDLLSRGVVRKLIISGVHFNTIWDDILTQKPFYKTITPEDIILEKRSRTTYENAQQTYILIQKLQCNDLLLITSYLHMYRAYRVFRKIFPPQYRFYKVAVAPPVDPVSAESYVIETFKSLFYSFWAY